MNTHKKTSKKIVKIFAIASIVLGSFMAISFTSKNFEIAKNLDIFATLFRELVINYVDDINAAELMKTGIDEMLMSLDPYTNFIPESEIEDFRFMTTGQYGGIGALIMRRGEYIFISETYDGFPAHKAGLLPGDKIIEINGQSAKSRNQEEISTLLKGQPGTEVEMIIGRIGHEEYLTKSLTREVVRIDNIPYYGMLNGQTGYIRLTGFTQNAGREVRDAILELKAENPMQALVLDLRGNGGGLLNEAVNITNLFVPKNTLIVQTKGKLEERNTTHRTLNPPLDENIPLVVLIDGSSASASEIVAGAIQDLDRGIVIGQRSFGKGLVQNVVPLSYNTQLKVTVAKYYIPSGRCIQAIDYAQRNEDGSVAFIPDSLQVAFTTSNGRTVFDGGGIEPDIDTETRQLSNISLALITQFLVFEYANEYYRTHDAIAAPDAFEISQEIFEDFKAFIKERDFTYQTQTERQLTALKNTAKKESYHSELSPELEELKTLIGKQKQEDIYTFREEIEMILKNEIVGRYYKQRGRIIASLSQDSEIEEALQLFSNLEAYKKFLHP